MTATDFAVSVSSLRHAGALLADFDPARVPVPAVDPGWATTAALDSVVATATGCLTALDTGVQALADGLGAAARAYELCDHEVAGLLR
jgi:Excreted virulence factor EspC, type VII ESX diderm